MQVIHTILNILNWVALNVPWEAVLASGILSTFLLAPKKLVKKYSKHPEVIMILLVGISGIVVATVNYLLHVPTVNPEIVALQGLALSFGTQPVYFMLVKPAVAKISAELAKAAAYDSEAKSAAVPASGLPVSATADFSQ